jgi:hypothetical protein
MRKATILITLIILVAPLQKAFAQYYFYDNNSYYPDVMYEIGASAGVMNCLTDIGGRKGLGGRFVKDINTGTTQFNGGAYFSATYKEAVSLTVQGTFGKVYAYDSILEPVKSTTPRYNRNLSFSSKINEYSIVAEFYPLFIFVNWESREDYPPDFSPYLLAGVGFLSFSPQTVIDGRTVDLQPLHTEGQGFSEYPNRKNYELKQTTYPIGIGLKWGFSNNFNARAEFIYRFMSTDYLDDLSTKYINPDIFSHYLSGTQLADAIALNDRRRPDPEYPINPDGGQIRGNPTNNDSYFSFNLKIGYTFGRKKIRTN